MRSVQNPNCRIVITGAGGGRPRGLNLPGLLEPTPENDLIARTLSGEVGLGPVPYDTENLDIHIYGLLPKLPPEVLKKAAGKRARRASRWMNPTAQAFLCSGTAACRESGILDSEGELTVDPALGSIVSAADVHDFAYAELQKVSLDSMMSAMDDPELLKGIIRLLHAVRRNEPGAKQLLRELYKTTGSEPRYIKALLDSDLGQVDAMLRSVSIGGPMALGMATGLTGGMVNITTACEAGFAALQTACDVIRLGRSKYVLTGSWWRRLGANSLFGLLAWRSIVSPGKTPDCCRPFDVNRNGLSPSEGGAMFVIEELQHALQRGAPILAEVAGMGAATAPQCLVEPNKDAFVRAMSEALTDAGINPKQIAYMSTHATGTVEGDGAEAAAILEVLGEEAKRIPITASKGGDGHHILGSASAEMLMTIRCAIERGLAPCNPTLYDQDPNIRLRLPRSTVEILDGRDYFLVSAAGFGGTHRALVLRKPNR